MNAEQLKIIAENSPRKAAAILGVHIREVRYHKQRMEGKSVKQPKEPKTNHKKWTQEEDNYLLTFGNGSTYPELQEALKASRTQIDHRCKILGVSPKKLKHHKTLAEEEKEVCLQGYPHQAAEKLGVSISTARRRRRELLKMDYRHFDARTSVPLPPSTPTKSLINFVSLNDAKQPVEPTWTPDNDRLLIKQISNNSIDKVAELFGQPKEQIEERLHHVLKEEKNKIGINEILSQFQMTTGQIHQMKLIYSYSPKSAVRYCEVIREYAKNKTAYSPARIRNDR
jgi:transposase